MVKGTVRKKLKREGHEINQLQQKIHRMKISSKVTPKRRARPAPAPQQPVSTQRPHQTQTLVARNNQMKSAPANPAAKVHPFYSWDPMTSTGPPSEIFSSGASTYVPAVMRTQLNTATMEKPHDLPDGVSLPSYYGYTVLVSTSSKSGIACVSLTVRWDNTPGPVGQRWVVAVDPAVFPKLTSANLGNELPESSRSGKYGYYIRNTSDQLILGGTIRSLRLNVGVDLPPANTIIDPATAGGVWTGLIQFILGHPETATYSGNQMTTGKALACIPVNQSDYMDYTTYYGAPSDLGPDDWEGGANYKYAKSLMAATGFDGKKYRYGQEYGHLAGITAAGNGIAAVRKAAAQQSTHSDADLTGASQLTASDLRAIQAANAVDAFLSKVQDPDMSVALLMFEPRITIDKINSYEITVGLNQLCRFAPNSLLNSLARPAPVAPLANHNAARAAGQSTKSFLTEVGDVAQKVGQAGAQVWGAAKTIGRIVAPLML